jgi:hypothetical protein
MAPARRPPRRQGVVYGPVQPYNGGSESASLVGRILGLLVVAGAIGVLVVGALAFTRGGGAENSPGPTAIAAESASPRSAPATAAATLVPATASPTLGAFPSSAPGGSPGASPGGSAGVSPGASPFELEVREGPGFVTFGTEANSRLEVTDPGTSFGADERITWSALLIEPASSDSLRVVIARFDPATGVEEPVREEEVRPRVASAQRFLRRIRPSEGLEGPGVYVIRYVRGDEVMAEGFFEVTP